ncbi:uncharacterized protein LOC128661455 [Bombina bombina]|uniref:uncharacterized protein LOC128661455 n=1 Tax=Bombina bombina TaxID=8345 RepID=UPI00235AF9FC|nr:uncharacterized protein LOC128661455 [Bombina bombina]
MARNPTRTPQPQPGRSTDEAPTTSRSSAAVSRPSTSAAHGQFIRPTSTLTHSSSSVDTLRDVRTSTPDTGVGRGTADLGQLFDSLTRQSSPLFDEEENSSREINLNLVQIREENQDSADNTGRQDSSQTSDLLDEFGDAQQFEIHTPENQDEQVETQAPPPQEIGDVNIANPPEVGLLADAGLTEMLLLARQYRKDHREMQNVINSNIERWAAISEKNI